MSWKLEYLPEAEKDLKDLDGSQRILVLKAIKKVQQNPLPVDEQGYGKPLGNHNSTSLAGLLKIKLRSAGLRVVYQTHSHTAMRTSQEAPDKSRSHLPHTLDFIAHGFCAGIAEMDMNLVGCLADFLYHRWRIFRRSGRSSGVCHLHSTGFFVHGAPFSERVCAAR